MCDAAGGGWRGRIQIHSRTFLRSPTVAGVEGGATWEAACEAVVSTTPVKSAVLSPMMAEPPRERGVCGGGAEDGAGTGTAPAPTICSQPNMQYSGIVSESWSANKAFQEHTDEWGLALHGGATIKRATNLHMPEPIRSKRGHGGAMLH